MDSEWEDELDPITPAPEWIFKIVNLLNGFLRLPLQHEPFNLNKDTADRIQRLVLALLDGNLSPEAFIVELRMAFRFVPLYRPTPYWVPLFKVSIPIVRQLLKADPSERESLLTLLFASPLQNEEYTVKGNEQNAILQLQQQLKQKQWRPQPPKRSSSLLYFFPQLEKSALSQSSMFQSFHAPQLEQNCYSSQQSIMNNSTNEINSENEIPFRPATLPRNQPTSRSIASQRQSWQQQQTMVQQKQQELQKLHTWAESRPQQQPRAQPQSQSQHQLQLQLLAQSQQQQRQMQMQQSQPQQQQELQREKQRNSQGHQQNQPQLQSPPPPPPPPPPPRQQQQQQKVHQLTQLNQQGYQQHRPKLQPPPPPPPKPSRQQQQQQDQLQQQDRVVSLTRDSSQLQLIIAEQRQIYVRASHLAELSPHFARLCADKTVKEVNGQRPLMLDDTYENVLEMLRCILPSELNGYELKPITVCNFATLVRMADKYVIARLMALCEDFVIQEFKYQWVEEGTVLMMLKTAACARQFNKEALAVIIGRAATFDLAVLKSANLLSLPPQVSNALHFAKHDYATYGPDKCIKSDGRRSDLPIIPSARVDTQLLQ